MGSRRSWTDIADYEWGRHLVSATTKYKCIFRSVEFANANVGFAGTLSGEVPNAQLFRTTDGGDNWINITDNLPQDVLGICGMHALDENTVFITGVFYGYAYIMRTNDQGENWEYMNMAGLANGLVDIHFKDQFNGIAVGQSAPGTGMRAVILGTSDGGDSWEQRSIGDFNNQRSWKIQYLTDQILYASIEEFEPSPQYFKSEDGGESWTLNTVETSNESGTMQGIGFLTEEVGFIGGWGDLLYGTEDGGDSWTYYPTVGQSFNRFFKVSDKQIVKREAPMYILLILNPQIYMRMYYSQNRKDIK